MERFAGPWFVCGGWAIDLFVGEVTREHEDIEIGGVRDDQEAVRSLFADWGLYKALPGRWVRGVWTCRRDPRVTRPIEDVFLRSATGIPIVAPEIQLLYKARHHQDKDEHDFGTALPLFSPQQRTWLREALAIVHPNDPWLAELS